MDPASPLVGQAVHGMDHKLGCLISEEKKMKLLNVADVITSSDHRTSLPSSEGLIGLHQDVSRELCKVLGCPAWLFCQKAGAVALKSSEENPCIRSAQTSFLNGICHSTSDAIRLNRSSVWSCAVSLLLALSGA